MSGDQEPLRLAVAVGPTLGHVHPALAFLEAYQTSFRVAPLVFGPDCRAVRGLVEGAGLPFVGTPPAPWQRASFSGKIRAGLRAASALRSARYRLSRHSTQCAVGFGGYSSGPVVLAARSLGAAVAIHEANLRPGMTNRWLARFVHRVFISQLGTRWPRRPVGAVLTGVPLRPPFLELAARTPDAPVPGQAFRLLVSSGSRGTGFLAREVPRLVGRLRAAGIPIEIRQQADAEHLPPLAEAYARLDVPAELSTYIQDMAAACAWAHLTICRAGAGTLAEVAAAALPAIVVPLADSSEGHQVANALAFAETGAGVAVDESAWELDAITEHVRLWASQPAVWRSLSERARATARPAASSAMIAECEAMLRELGSR